MGRVELVIGVGKGLLAKEIHPGRVFVNNVTVETILRAFQALRANVSFRVELRNKRVQTA